MIITAKFHRLDSDIIKDVTLPLSQDEFATLLNELGIVQQGAHLKSDIKGLPLKVTYDVTSSHSNLACMVKRLIAEEKNFVAVNLLAQAIDICEDYSYDAVDCYIELDSPLFIYELADVLIHAEDIIFHFYEYNESTILASLGKSYYYLFYYEDADDNPLVNYVDWDAYGSDLAYNVTYTEYGFLFDDDPGISTGSIMCVEELCDELDWDYSNDNIEYTPYQPIKSDEIMDFLWG